jgi:hypothetical protein
MLMLLTVFFVDIISSLIVEFAYDECISFSLFEQFVCHLTVYLFFFSNSSK